MLNIDKLVSIVIAVRTNDYLLEKCINKIRNYYNNINIIVVYDFLENNNLNQMQNITYLKSNNLNMSAKRNQGVEYAKTKYIAFIDSDAYPVENWLENAIEFLENTSDYSAVTGTQYSPPEDNFEQQCLRLLKYSPLFTHSEWRIVIDKNAKPQDVTEFSSANVIIKKEDYVKLNGMNENIYLAEDNEFSTRLTSNGYKIKFIPQVAIFHRESNFIPFFKKIWAMGYYYSNMFIKGKNIKNTKQTIVQFLPLLGVTFFVFLWLLFLFLRLNPYILLVLPLFAFLILISSSYTTTKQVQKNKLKAFFFILYAHIIFCMVYVLSSLFGLINIQIKEVHECYKQY